MGISSHLPLEERLNGVFKDGPNLIYELSRLDNLGDLPIEISCDLPAATDPDIILGYVARWSSIAKYFNKDLRVYAWSYSTQVEKYVMSCVQNIDHVFVTILPMYLKEVRMYG